ncbi:Uncharacterised protein [BD1-7 clade bacterium]|uniref:Uncharacterized protein n=1 Tax=BD1-7 clade bacterium TaxID=2029982 RepID=A0A5S9QF24_9GAMM|nr:Uncharacterised protein [BD1-7 clade bacterium]
MLNFILMRAERACDYVSNSVRIRATNKQEGINRTFEEKEARIFQRVLEQGAQQHPTQRLISNYP